ncbi:MAG: ABC transporter ATP-binding protein [Lachnospiraceae bacterium]|nr:ABC transporter ATP-binding protein [Lachnospiraceae bacterium]
MNPLLKLEHVSYSYHDVSGETFALSDISFSLNPGEFLAIVGPSGCGKSTLLSLICGLLQPEEGSISLLGKPLGEAGANIGYMLQKDHLFEWRTVYSNVTLGLEIQKKLTKEHLSNVDSMLETYGLSSFKDARPSQLSGGMRQRAALIRTLALEPDLLLLDEPFSALDYQTRLSVCDDISAIIKKEEKTAILVTHDLSEAISMADHVLVLSRRPGRVQKIVPISFDMEDRTPMRSRNAPKFKEYFNLIWKELNTSG